VPTTVQAVYGAQLDDLPPEPRRIVRRGSVAGRRLPARALPVLGIEDADTALGGLVRRALLDGPVTDAVAGEAYLYRHALLRDAGYSSLSHAERAALHVRMARWLEAAAGSRSDAVAEAIGGHYAAAADGAPLLALEVGDGLGREDARALAAAWLERAAGASLAAGAMAAAAELYARAADRTDPARKLDRSRRSRRAGETAARVGDMGGAAVRLETAMEAAREAAGDPVSAPAAREALAVAAASLSRVVAEQLGFERAWTLAEEVLAEIGAGDDPPAARLRLRAAVARGMFSDDPAEVVEVARQALEVAQRAGDRELELDALPALLSAVENRDELSLAAERLAAVGRREGRWDLVVRALRIGATIAVESGSDPGPLFDEAQEIAADRGLAEALGWICHDRALFAFRAGDWSSARAAGLAALDLALPRAYLRICVRAWLVLVPVAAWTGDRDLLEQADRWFADNLPRLPDSPYGRLSQAAVDVALSGAELVAAPDLDPRRLLPSFEGDLGGPDWSETLDTVVRAWIEGGRIDAVRDAVRACRRHLPGAGPLEVGTVGLLAARWERAAGRPEQAGREAREALASFRAACAPWWIAKSLRLLEDVGAASAAEIAEARAIEAGLGVVGRAP